MALKKFKKIFKKLLTNQKKYGIIITVKERKKVNKNDDLLRTLLDG
jgi:hypothetical protein